MQAALFECFFFDLFPFLQDLRCAPEVGVCRCHVADAFVATMMIIVVDELPDRPLKRARQIVVFQQNAVLVRLMPTLDLPLGLRMVRRTANMIHSLIFEPDSQVARDVRGTIIAEQ